MDDITGAIMTAAKLEKLRKEWERIRGQGGIRASELAHLARALHREERIKPGADHVWKSHFHDLPDVTISAHPSTTMNKYTARKVLDGLEEDVERWGQVVES
jgi:hypothetical protein